MLGSTDYHESRCAAAHAEYRAALKARKKATASTVAACDERIRQAGDVCRAADLAFYAATATPEGC